MAKDELVAARYTHIQDRGKYASLAAVRRELRAVIEATPGSIHALERKGYLEAIFGDLDPNGGKWITWPEDVHLLALTAVKVLGRNPDKIMEVLIQPDNLATLVFHSALQAILPGITSLTPVSSRSSHSLGHYSSLGFAPATGAEISSRSVRDGRAVPPPPNSRPAQEALRGLSNILLMSATARERAARYAVGEAVARALQDNVSMDHLMLLCRIGFLMTTAGPAVEGTVRAMVEDEHIVPRLGHHLNTVPPVESNYFAVVELLKLTTNILNVVHNLPPLPNAPRGGIDPRVAALHFPVLACMYNLEDIDLNMALPMSRAIHALVFIPFDPNNISTWYTVPGAHPGGLSLTSFRSNSSRPSTTSSISSAEDKPKKKGLFGRKRRDSTPTDHLAVPERKESAPLIYDMGAEDTPTHVDIGAFPRRLMDILNNFIKHHLKGTDPAPADLKLDEILSPILLLATHAAEGSAEIRDYFRGSLLPTDLDRSAKAGPLQARVGLLGTLLRLLESTPHPLTRSTTEEFLYSLSRKDPHVLVNDLGYGAVAGLLFRKGFAGPPEAKIEVVEEEAPSEGTSYSQQAIPEAPRSARSAPYPYNTGGVSVDRRGSGGTGSDRRPSTGLAASQRQTPSPGPGQWPTRSAPSSRPPSRSHQLQEQRPSAQRSESYRSERERAPPPLHQQQDQRPPTHRSESYRSERERPPPLPRSESYRSERERPTPPLPQASQLPYAQAPYMQPLPAHPSSAPRRPSAASASGPSPALPAAPLPPRIPHSQVERDPITGLNRQPDGPSPFEGLSQAERDRETDRLLAALSLIDENPVLSAGVPNPNGGQRGLREEMHARYQSGEADAWERAEAERERRRILEQEEEDERIAMAEMARYRQRRGNAAH